jgi:tetratricopeptide (TPR) repeat protein
MPNRLSRLIASAVLVSALGMSQQTLSDADHFGAAARENDPAKKLALLDRWTAQFPETAFKQQRNLQYISGYSMLAGNATKANASAEALTAGQNAARTMLDKGNELFAPDMMPAGVKDGDWAAARQDFVRQAHSVLATVALNEKNYAEAEAELAALLEMNHDDPATSFQLGRAIVAEMRPERYPAAIFHLARAVTAAGPGAFNEAARKPMEAYLENIYRNYHGDLSGLDEVKRASSEAWIPPAGWTIQSVAAITRDRLDGEEKFAREHPEAVLWRNLKARLTATDGDEYFAAEVRGAGISNLKGKVLAQPDAKTMVVVMDFVDPAKPQAAEATLKLDSALRGRVAAGTVVEFTGVPQAFAKDPFMVTMSVEVKNVKGLTR